MTYTFRSIIRLRASLALCLALASGLGNVAWGENPNFASRFNAWQGVQRASYDTSVLHQPEGSMPAPMESALPAPPTPRSATAVPAQRQVVPSPPMTESWATSNGTWDEPSMGCSDGCCGVGGCGGACGISDCCGGGLRPYQRCHSYCAPLWWAKAEAILWWRSGRESKPLVTSDPSNEASGTAGVLPDATILYGPDTETTQMQAGAMFELGTWIDDCQSIGVGGRFWMLGRDSGSHDFDSATHPVLAVPFFNVDLGTNDTLLVAYPGLREGSIDVNSSSEVFGGDLFAKFLFSRNQCSRIDLFTGYQFGRINDELSMQSLVFNTDVTDVNAVGSSTRVIDRFTTRNEFHGGILGASWEYDHGCWSLGLTGRVALGNMYQSVQINGSTLFTDVGGNQQFNQTGLYAQTSNSGTQTRNDFAAVPEFNVKLGYSVCQNTKLTIGYNFMYYSSVVRADDQIDQSIDTVNDTRPTTPFETSGLVLQGLNLGVEYDF